jgi:hypothetical protein
VSPARRSGSGLLLFDDGGGGGGDDWPLARLTILARLPIPFFGPMTEFLSGSFISLGRKSGQYAKCGEASLPIIDEPPRLGY